MLCVCVCVCVCVLGGGGVRTNQGQRREGQGSVCMRVGGGGGAELPKASEKAGGVAPELLISSEGGGLGVLSVSEGMVWWREVEGGCIRTTQC